MSTTTKPALEVQIADAISGLKTKIQRLKFVNWCGLRAAGVIESFAKNQTPTGINEFRTVVYTMLESLNRKDVGYTEKLKDDMQALRKSGCLRLGSAYEIVDGVSSLLADCDDDNNIEDPDEEYMITLAETLKTAHEDYDAIMEEILDFLTTIK